MQRPTGVTILGVLCFIGAGLLAIAALIFIAGGTLLSSLASSPIGGKLIGVGGAVVGAILLVIGVIYVLIGIGLLNLRNWARILMIVLVALGLLSAVAGLMTSLIHVSPVLLARELIIAGIDVWILIYLFRPHVKQAFGATSV